MWSSNVAQFLEILEKISVRLTTHFKGSEEATEQLRNLIFKSWRQFVWIPSQIGYLSVKVKKHCNAHKLTLRKKDCSPVLTHLQFAKVKILRAKQLFMYHNT